MKKILPIVISVVVSIALIVIGFLQGFNLEPVQLKALKICGIICASSALYCFVVGEISRNNSQMDKLWSVLPIAYTWVIAGLGNMKPRLVIIAALVTIWGVRLTYNFAKKGAYKLKFWEGEEDYRWKYLRTLKIFQNKFVWGIFDLLFISIYQNFIVLGMTLPAISVMASDTPIGVFDILVSLLMAFFVVYEIIADKQQNKFQVKKYEYLNAGKKLNELPEPYSRGFYTKGLWNRSRHPNYLGEQGIWVALYLFVITSGIATWGIFNWSIFGCLLIILIFVGSSRMSESMMVKKYSEYPLYQKQVFKYLPIKKYKGIE